MSMPFESYLSEHQADMIRTALEYVDGRADEVFAYAASEEGTFSFNVFYKINSQIVRKEKINSALISGDVAHDDSRERISAMIDIGLDNIDAIEERCLEYAVKAPTEMRLHYDVRSGKLHARLRYDNVFSDIPDMLPGNIFDAWFSSELEKGSDATPAQN